MYIYISMNYFMNNLDWWIATWMYILMVYYMNNLLMKYYMKVCIDVDDYYMSNFVDELLYECLCWINMIIWCCNYMMNTYEIIMLMLLLLLVVVVVLRCCWCCHCCWCRQVVDVVRCCWCCHCCWCRQVVEVVRCYWLSCWVHAYSYKVGGLMPCEC